MKYPFLLLISSLALYLFICLGYRNMEDTKGHAEETLAGAGFKIVGYEGYEWSPILGAKVWYDVKQNGDDKTLYDCFLIKWGSEYHIYCLKALNAVSTK